MTVGKYHDGSSRSQPKFMHGILSHGMTFDVTPYGGASGGKLPFGGGRGGWVKTLATGEHSPLICRILTPIWSMVTTNREIAGYRYSTLGYYNFTDTVAERDRYEDGYLP
ncbi:hypothetical protein M5G07_08010 [Serratia symbiotica]|nr:hypothetical protein [Serratia symbiotica]